MSLRAGTPGKRAPTQAKALTSSLRRLIDVYKRQGYEQDELRFWLSVLSLAVNQVPPSTFQADRLYRIGVSISSQDLSEMLNAHMSKLRAAEKVLERLIKRPLPDSKADMDEILAIQKIDVDFERVDNCLLYTSRCV